MTSGSNASKFPTVCSRFLKMKNVIESFCVSEHLLAIDSFVCLFVCLLLHQVRFNIELRMEKGVIFLRSQFSIFEIQVCSFFSSFGFLAVLRCLKGGGVLL